MNTLTKTTPETAATLRMLAVAKLRRALDGFVASFDATPDDKLDLKLSETANSPREMIIHVISGNAHVGSCLGITQSAEAESTDRPSLVAKLRESTETIIAKIESMPDEAFDTSVSFFGHDIPMPFFAFIDEWHLCRHAAQIDFLQTMWGDMENRF